MAFAILLFAIDVGLRIARSGREEEDQEEEEEEEELLARSKELTKERARLNCAGECDLDSVFFFF